VNDEGEKPKPLLKDWRVRGAAAAGVVAGFLIGLVIFGVPWHLPPAWGDIPAWLLVVLAGAAGWVGFAQLSALRQQITEDMRPTGLPLARRRPRSALIRSETVVWRSMEGKVYQDI
jgi:hypothetical protein